MNQIYCGDHLKIIKDIDDESIDLVVTSPPYDKLRTYKGYSFDFKSLVKDLFRVIKKGGVVVWVVGDATVNGSETGTSFRQALYFKDIGFNLHDTMIYETNKPPLTHNRYEQKFEYMFVFSIGKPRVFNPLLEPCECAGAKRTATMRQDSDELGKRSAKGYVKDIKIKSNIWYLPRGGGSHDELSVQHPATFPEQLAQDHIISWSNENDIVLDPMCGSGTTCKMALLNNRCYIGIDISPEYCEITRQRLEKANKELNRTFRLGLV